MGMMFNLAENRAEDNIIKGLETVEQELENEIKNAAEKGRFEIFYKIDSCKYPFLSYSRQDAFTFQLSIERWLRQKDFIYKDIFIRDSNKKWKYYGYWICWDKTGYRHTNEYTLPENFKIVDKSLFRYWKKFRKWE